MQTTETRRTVEKYGEVTCCNMLLLLFARNLLQYCLFYPFLVRTLFPFYPFSGVSTASTASTGQRSQWWPALGIFAVCLRSSKEVRHGRSRCRSGWSWQSSKDCRRLTQLTRLTGLTGLTFRSMTPIPTCELGRYWNWFWSLSVRFRSWTASDLCPYLVYSTHRLVRRIPPFAYSFAYILVT